MTPQSDGLVTKEDIQELDKLALMIHVNDRGIYLGDALMLCQKLLAERDSLLSQLVEQEQRAEAYREVAIGFALREIEIGPGDNASPAVDAAARRILKTKKEKI